MPLTVKQWVMTQPIYIEAASARDTLLVEVSELGDALKGAALGHRKESGLLAADLEALRSEQATLQSALKIVREREESLSVELEALRTENTQLRGQLGTTQQDSLKVLAV